MRLEQLAELVPEAARQTAQLAVDNPLTFTVAISAGIVAPRLAFRLVRPRTLLEVIALGVLLEVGLTYGLARAVSSGLLPVYIRDPAGARIPLHGGAGVTDRADTAG